MMTTEQAIEWHEGLLRYCKDKPDEPYWGKQHNAMSRDAINAALAALRAQNLITSHGYDICTLQCPCEYQENVRDDSLSAARELCPYCETVVQTNSHGRSFGEAFPTRLKTADPAVCLSWNHGSYSLYFDDDQMNWDGSIDGIYYCPKCGRKLQEPEEDV